MEIYSSPYKTTDYLQEESIMINRWTNAEMDDTTFQEEILGWVDLVEKYEPSYMLANTQKFNYIITVEMQEWTNTEVFPRIIKAGVKKFAVIVSRELIVQLALEQTMDEENTGAFQSRYFDNEEAAIEWFKR